MRLDKVLSNMGYGSRKDVKKYIKDGLVSVNGKVIVTQGSHVNPDEDEIVIGNSEVNYREFVYIMMNKPDGYVSSTEDPLSPTVLELLEVEHLIFDPFPAGRLDKDTVGLLLMTNDGKLAHELLSPKKGVDKTYYAEIDGVVTKEHVEAMKKGVVLDDDYKTMPAELEILDSDIISKIELTIQEGKYHQVKRMFESLGMNVVYLKRIKFGSLELDENLEEGEYRELTEKELEELRNKED